MSDQEQREQEQMFDKLLAFNVYVINQSDYNKILNIREIRKFTGKMAKALRELR